MNINLKFAFEKETKGRSSLPRCRRGRCASVRAAGRYALRPQKRNAKRQDPENTCCHYYRRITALTLTASQAK